MRGSLQATIAAFWLVFWSARLLMNFDRLVRTEDGRILLALYGLAVALGAIFMIILLMKKIWPKAMYKAKRESRCPECYAKLLKDSEFCPKCGKDLRERDEARVCWYCGYEEMNKNSTSCPKCGREYKK